MKDAHERVYLVDDVVGHVVCWRVLRLGDGGRGLRGMDEISASRVGVFLRGGAQRGWRLGGASAYPIVHGPRARRLDRFLRLAAATHRLLAEGRGPMLPSEELCVLGEFPYVKPLAVTTTMVDNASLAGGGW